MTKKTPSVWHRPILLVGLAFLAGCPGCPDDESASDAATAVGRARTRDGRICDVVDCSAHGNGDCREVSGTAPVECVEVPEYGGKVCQFVQQDYSGCPEDADVMGVLCHPIDGHLAIGCEPTNDSCDVSYAQQRDGGTCEVVHCRGITDCRDVSGTAPVECVDVPEYGGAVCQFVQQDYSGCPEDADVTGVLCHRINGHLAIGCEPTSEVCVSASDAGDMLDAGPDASGALDAGPDASNMPDASNTPDASSTLDASDVLDAGPDASDPPDADEPGNVPVVVSVYPPVNRYSGQTGQFTAIVNDNPASYAWDFGGGATPNTSSAVAPTVTFGAVGNYTVSLIVSNASGSSALYSTSYSVDSPSSNAPVITSVSQTGYLGATGTIINFNAGATDADGATWVWDFGTGAALYGDSQQFSAITLADPGVHHGSVTATTAAGSGMLEFTFLVSASAITPPPFQTFSVASSPFTALPPSAILLSDSRPLVAYATSAGHVAVSVADSAAPSSGSSFAVHEVDAALSSSPRALAATLLGSLPVLAYVYPDAFDLVLAVSIGTMAPTQSADWTRHEVARMSGAASSTAADVELLALSGNLVIALATDAGLEMALAQVALPTASTDWAIHTLDASSTLRDCALADAGGPVVGYVDDSGTLRFASATTQSPTQTSDWAIHIVETFAGLSDVSMTVMGSSAVLSAAGTTIFGVEHLHRALNSGPTSATDWESSEGAASGAHSLITLEGRLATAGVLSGFFGDVVSASRTVLPDVILVDGWQSRQLSASVTTPQMGDALGLSDGRLAFCYVDAASTGTVVFAQANAAW